MRHEKTVDDLDDETARATKLAALTAQIRACRICRDEPARPPALPHEPRPVLRPSVTAKLCVCGQAPGTRVHASGTPFMDPSGARLRDWMGVSADQFYDDRQIAILPMGFCFPGLDAKGGDLPPRKECARRWRRELFALQPQFELVLLIGHHAQKWHLGARAKRNMTETVRNWREYVRAVPDEPDEEAGRKGMPATDISYRYRYLPLPHPSWRNNGWLKANDWFEAELVPYLQAEVARCLERGAAFLSSAPAFDHPGNSE